MSLTRLARWAEHTLAATVITCLTWAAADEYRRGRKERG